MLEKLKQKLILNVEKSESNLPPNYLENLQKKTLWTLSFNNLPSLMAN